VADDSQPKSVLIGCDVGGTFTDAVAWDGAALTVLKVPTVPGGFHGGIIEATKRLARRVPSRLVHGSTVATNALIQRGGKPVVFVTNQGFEDLFEIARQRRPELYALEVRKPEPLVARRHCFGLSCRTAADGRQLAGFDEAEAADVVRQIKATGLADVAVCLLFSFADDSHETAFAELARAAGLRVTISSEVLPEFREYERATTTAAAAHLKSPVGEYLEALADGLPKFVENVRVLDGGGGTLALDAAATHAVRLTLSGPAGGVAAAAWLADRHGLGDVVSYDMGGTSTDVALIRDGRCPTTTQRIIGGVPVAVPMLDIHTVGAGGGSIAFRDAGGMLRVGPRSAGAVPGPACYHKGGTLPTVTDAHVVLGRLPGDLTLGDHLPLHSTLAAKVIGTLADELGQTPEQTAHDVIAVADAGMARAVRDVTAARGVDPRPLTLVSFGGAGGLHACAIAEQLGMKQVVVPPMGGVFSALGMLVAPPAAEAGRTVLHLKDVLDADRLHAEAGSLNAALMDELPEAARVEVWADCRFAGQSHELPVLLPSSDLGELRRAFEAVYVEQFGEPPEAGLEVVNLRVRRIGEPNPIELPPLAEEPERGEATVCGRFVPRLNRAAVHAKPADGPAVITDHESTTWLAPDWQATATDDGTLFLRPTGGT
jgi:N-methylhydantoinase A